MNRSWCAAALVLLVAPSALVAQAEPKLEAFHYNLHARFGETFVSVHHNPGYELLLLEFRDPRFRVSKPAANDSTLTAVAKFAASKLPVGYKPDSLTVRIVTSEVMVAGMGTRSTSSKTFAVASLK